MRIAITGAKGVVGQAFIQNANTKYEIIELNLPDNDVMIFNAYKAAASNNIPKLLWPALTTPIIMTFEIVTARLEFQ